MTKLRIKELAEQQGLNIQHLAQRAGVSYSTAHSLWHDRVEQWNRRTLDRMALALGVRVADLFAGDPIDTRAERPIP